MNIFAACTELASTGFGDSSTVALVGTGLLVAGAAIIALRSKSKALAVLLAIGLSVGSLTFSPSNVDAAQATCHSDNSGDSSGSGDGGTDPGDGDGAGGTDPGDGDGGDDGDGTDPDDGGIVVSNAVNNGNWGENYHPIYCVGFQTPMVQIGNANIGDYIVFNPGSVPGSIADYTWTINGVEANSWGPYGSDKVIVWHDETLFSSGQTVTVTVTDGVTTYQFNATFS